MDKTELIAAVLHTVLAFGALWILIACCWRSHRLDALRDKLFEVRHDLFLMGERREVAFDDPAYWMLRAQLNRMLARAHRITGLMLLLRAPNQIEIENPRKRWIESLSTVPIETRRKLEQLEDRMSSHVMWHIIVGSPVTVLILLYGISSMLIQSRGESRREPHRVIADEVARSIEALDRIPPEEKDVLATVG